MSLLQRLAQTAVKTAACAALAAAAVCAGATSASAMRLAKFETGRPGAATFLMQGEVVSGDTERLKQAIAKLAPGTSVAVILDSDGGDLMEGMQLGHFFHQSKIATFVKADGGRCHSACSLAFLGGRDPRTGEPMRVKPSSAALGFHQFRKSNYDPLKIYTKADFAAEVAMAQEVTKVIVRYLKLIGEDLDKLQLMLRAPAEGMNIISNEECLRRGFSVIDEATGRVTHPGRDRQRISAL